MSADTWQARIEGAMQAHFKQPDGPSRPGTDYKVGLKRGEQVCGIFVRAYLADDLTPAARADTHYQQQTVIGYVFDRLTPDWAPTGEMFPFPALTILNPDPGHAHPAAPRKGFLAKLFGK
jgi:hypothetical protein